MSTDVRHLQKFSIFSVRKNSITQIISKEDVLRSSVYLVLEIDLSQQTVKRHCGRYLGCDP